MQPYDLYKGATRAPETFNIPRNIFLFVLTISAAFALILFKPLVMISIPIYFFCLRTYRDDKDGFAIVHLWIVTTWLHKLLKGDDAEYSIEDYSEKEMK